MRVQLKNLLPNPYRNLPEYPIDEAKIDRLRKSMRRTGFWDNLVARKAPGAPGKVEIAYGHHRREALLRSYPAGHEISVIVRELDDATMIKVMADENDEVYNLSPAVINETVRAARDYLRGHPGEFGVTPDPGKDQTRERLRIADFLGWDASRVQEALAEISDIESGQIDKGVLESIPSQQAAEVFRKEVKKHKASKHVQRAVALKLSKRQIGTSEIKSEIIRSEYGKKERKEVEFEEYLWEVKKDASRLADKLARIAAFHKDLHGEVYARCLEKVALFRELRRLHEYIESFITRRSDDRAGQKDRKAIGRQ